MYVFGGYDNSYKNDLHRTDLSAVTSALNGRPVLRFDGTDDYLDLTATAANIARNVGGLTIFCVTKLNDVATTGFALFISTNTVGYARAHGCVYNQSGSGTIRFGGRRLDADANSLTGTLAPNTNPHVSSAVYNYASSDLYGFINGSSVVSNTSFQTDGNTSDTDSGEVVIARGSSAYLKADIAAIIVYNRALAEHERCQVEHYLSQRYGIAVSSSIPQPLALFLDASMGVTTVDGKCSQWSDQSGNARHASQGTADYRPLLVQGGLNGRPVLRFDGTDDRIESAVFPSNLPQPFTMFVCFKSAVQDTNKMAVALGGIYQNNTICIGCRYTKYGMSNVLTHSKDSPVSVDTNWHIVVGVLDGDNSYAVCDGQAGEKASMGTTEQSTWRLGSYILIPPTSCFLNGDIAAAIVFNRALSDAERQRVERWLATRYGITLA